jgi:tripartite-type tricarboxylate transporter receptor subunit TctC
MTIRALVVGGVAVALLGGDALAQSWPQRPVEISVWASAGGGTDTVNRYLAEAMQPHLGGRINVVNRTGGGGGVAMNHVWTQPRDGHAWLGASEGMQVVRVLDYHDSSTKDWRWYMVAGAKGVISVPEASPFQTLDDLVAEAKANPGQVRVSHCAIGCVWHMKALALGHGADIELNYIPYEGSATAQTAALSGEVEAVVSSIQEQAEFIKAGHYRPLAMIEMEPFDFPELGEIPAAGATYPGIADIPAAQWLGMAIPKDTPEEIVAQIDAAFEEAMKDPKIDTLRTERFMTLMGQYGDEAEEILLGMERTVSWKLYELGVAEQSPEEVGIAQP